jgi:hypothetical protein
MLARSRRTDKLVRRGRNRSGDDSTRSGRGAGAPDPAHDPARTTFVPEAEALDPARPDADPSQDTAVYNCHCGMVFEAAVCTSVDCPHCGVSQAW